MPESGNPCASSARVPVDVVFIHPSRGGQPGGILNAGLSYIRGLLAQGHRVTVLTASSFLAHEAQALGLPVTYDVRLRSWIAVLLDTELRRLFRDAARRTECVVLHNTGHLWPLVWLLGSAHRHAVVYHNRKIRGRGYFRHWLAISSTQRDRLQLATRWRPWVLTVQQIKNGALPSRSPVVQRSTGGPVVVGALAEFRPEKNMALLVVAAERLKAAGLDVIFRVGGDGEQMNSVRNLAEERGVADRFIWLGWVSDIDAFFASIDVLALPSLDEPFGLVVLEALLRGRPVIATRSDGPVDILAARDTVGWLVDVGDDVGFTAALSEAIRHPDDRLARGKNAFLHAEEVYGDIAIGAALSEALDIVLSGRVRSSAAAIAAAA